MNCKKFVCSSVQSSGLKYWLTSFVFKRYELFGYGWGGGGGGGGGGNM